MKEKKPLDEFISPPKEQQVNHEDTPEYQEGLLEYQTNGNKKMKCPESPYEDGQKISWLVGWLDARTADALSKVR